MLTRLAVVVLLALLLAGVPRAKAAAYDGHPKLVVLIVIDQFRADYLQRYRAEFKGRGFRLFLDKGAYFPDCYYGYANTKTAPGHATLGTGAYTDGHGISSNEWWDLSRDKDRPISSVEDERYTQVGLDPPPSVKSALGASPRNLLASTIGDELRLSTGGASRVYGVSLKDRAAILPAGAAANGAFWIDGASGRFVTSSYYMRALPQWAADFNNGPAIAQAAAAANVADLTNFYKEVGPTDAANGYELAFTEALITGEQMGSHETTDLLTVSLSPNDLEGHQYGPDSPEEHRMVDGLDADLDAFTSWLETHIPGGLENVVLALSADHGIAPTPAVSSALGLPGAVINVDKLVADLNQAMNAKFSPGENVVYLLPNQELPYLSLNRSTFERAGIIEQEAEDAVKAAMEHAFTALAAPNTPADQQETQAANAPPPASEAAPRAVPSPRLFRAYTRQELAVDALPPTEFGRLLAHSYSPNGGWYVAAIPIAFQMQGTSATGTTHFSPWSYDRHVPLGFYGAPFLPGTYRGRVEPVDIAATLASVLGINQPSASVGRILTQALRPVGEFAYPKPPVLIRRRTRRAPKAAADAPPAAIPVPTPAAPVPPAPATPQAPQP